MQIEQIPLKELTPYTRNSRTHSEEQITQVVASIVEYGWTNPVLIDDSGMIIAGHGRTMAAARLKMTEVPCIRLSNLSENQKRAYIIADNQIALNAGWDEALLHEELEALKIEEYDLQLLGFSDAELDDLLTDTEEEVVELPIPEPPVNPTTKLGEIYQLGNHRLMCGDSTSIDAVERLMDGRKADMVFTDPPYGIDFAPQRGTHGKILNDALDGAEFDNFLDAVFGAAFASMKPDTYAFVWTGWPKIGAFERSLQKFFKIQAMHIWVKNNFGIGYYSRPKHEPFYLCLNGKPVYPANAPADVWEAKKVHKTVHSCEKPVDLIVDILDTYHKNSTVLDLFGGSGSTLIACEKTNRKCYGMELDPKYCDVIIERWENFTNKKAVKVQ
jgi:DNA modification methylase